MALTYLIDGYNLIHALGLVHKRIAPGELEQARRRLLEFLHEKLEPRGGSITVVFDAKRRPRQVPSEYVDGTILVRYAGRDEEADDVIEKLVAEHSAPDRLVVVSEDRRLKLAAAHRHARSVGCQELLAHLERRTEPPPVESDPQKPERVSDAEVKEWLREFSDVKLPDEFRDFLDPPAEEE